MLGGGVPALAFADVALEEGVDSVTAGVVTGDIVYFGSYPQSAYTPISAPGTPAENTPYTDTDGTQFVYSGSSYYKIEPIAWRVLSNDGTDLFLLADQNLDAGTPYHQPGGATTWETSNIRAWLNGYPANPNAYSFLGSAFSTKEQSAIATTTVVNGSSSNPDYPTPGGADTLDKVFFLSVAEVRDSLYGFPTDVNMTDTRVALNTAYTASKPGILYAAGEANTWWLRSPGMTLDSLRAANVHGAGGVFVSNWIDAAFIATRPAINLNLSSVIFTSAASGEHAKSAVTTADGFVDATSSATSVKFTLLDTDTSFLNLAIGDTTARTTVPGGSVSVAYTGAIVGADKYVSAVLTDTSDNVLYYAKLSAQANDTASLIIPSGIAPGNYQLKLFNEQANGDGYADFSSTPITIALTVNAVVSDAPTAVAAVAGDAQATVSFTAPANDGGSPITGYTVTATPVGGGAVVSATGSASPITVSGLTNGVAYTFTVVATNAVGVGAASAASNAVTPLLVTSSGDDESGDPDGSGSGSGSATYGSTLPGTGDNSLPPALLAGILGLAGLGLSVISTRRKSYVGVHRR